MNCMRRKRIQVIWINLFHSYFVFYNTKTFLLYLLFVMETNKQEKTRQSSFFFGIHTFYFYPTILDSSKINKVWKFLYDDVDVDQILLEIKIHKLYYPCVCENISLVIYRNLIVVELVGSNRIIIIIITVESIRSVAFFPIHLFTMYFVWMYFFSFIFFFFVPFHFCQLTILYYM